MFMTEYLTNENLKLIILALERFITQHEEEVKLEKLKATFQESKKAADDTLIGFSQQSTQVTEIVQLEESKTESLRPRASELKKTNSSSQLLKELIGDLDSLGLNSTKAKEESKDAKVKDPKQPKEIDKSWPYGGLDDSDDNDYVPEVRDPDIEVPPPPQPKWLIKKQMTQVEDEEKEAELDIRV